MSRSKRQGDPGDDVFSYDAYGSARATADTEDLARALSYDEFGKPQGSDPSDPLIEELFGLEGNAAKDHRPLFGYRGEMHLDGRIHLRARLRNRYREVHDQRSA